MSRIEKEIARLKLMPKDFTYQELKRILNYFGFIEDNKGKTSGSRVIFINKDTTRKITLHKPHNGNNLKPYQIKDVLEKLFSLGGK